jgi:3-deoxy-D-manno-octulosonic-acid transferase
MRLLLTHGTATGREAGRALLREGDAQVWLPLDTPGATRRFVRHFSPRVGLLMETEVWPNLMAASARAGLPVLLVNARLSDKSLRRGQRLAWLMRPAARALRGALAQTPEDARRLREMGVERVDVMGNLKYDMQPDETLMALGRRWREASPRPVVMAASTREGEEEGLLDAWRKALTAFDPKDPARPRLLLVPRHPQRFDAVAQMIGGGGFSLSRRSAWGAGSDPHGGPDAAAQAADVWLGDSLGEMPAYYAAADVALLGGSFAPLGGQNLIEAAACACPVIMGPHTFNFAQAARTAEQAGAALRVADITAGVQAAVTLIGDPPALKAMSRQAVEVAGRDRGAAQRALRVILGAM